MPTKKFNPTTPGQRFKIAMDYSVLTKKKPEKSLLLPWKQKSGRNNAGEITVPSRGGGHKRHLRIVDFKRQKHNIPAIVKSLEYDPGRSAFICLLHYKDGEKRYIVAPKEIKVGDQVISGIENISPEPGNAMPLKAMPIGTIIHNIELNPGGGAKCARSAGSYAQLVAREGKNATIKLPSGEMRLVNKECMATVGTVSKSEHKDLIRGKAGKSRHKGERPHTRGTVRNPVDHPMGGGEGKTSGGHPRSRTGVPAKGYRTRKRDKYSDKMIITRRK